MKKRWINLITIMLCILLIIVQIGALLGYWYNNGNILGLIAAIILLSISIRRYRNNK